MSSLKIRRNLLADDIRRMCINLNLYTKGTCNEYSRILNTYNGYISDDDLEMLSTDIVEHSDVESLDRTFGPVFGDDMSFYIACVAESLANDYSRMVAFY
ncbi:MAG: hypothetical protein HDR16_05325 [Lachnospiraceae bacterium]|nr:hypothetical protein [Lachnospiraceae bacterium]